jgi:hypothetical protein
MRFRPNIPSGWIKGLVLLSFLLLPGYRGDTLASTVEVPLQVEGDRLTGHLSQVTLRTVLEELQKQLGITYEAPAGELDKVISVDLQQDPILPALAKILAPWDYAFTVNAAGHLQFLYVTSKAPPAEAVSETSEPSDSIPSNTLDETGFNSFKSSDEGSNAGDTDPSLSYGRELDPIRPPSSSAFDSPSGEISGSGTPMAVVPMPVQPVPDGTTMPWYPLVGIAGCTSRRQSVLRTCRSFHPRPTHRWIFSRCRTTCKRRC